MTRQERSGACIWVTGLSGAGKSTIASYLANLLTSSGLNVTVLDGDKLRNADTRNLTFSREDRRENILSAGRTALNEVQKGDTAIAALVSPYEDVRQEVKQMFEPEQFFLVYLSTPLATCEARDPKGLYKRARAGLIDNFTGITDPYESPLSPDISIDTTNIAVSKAVSEICLHPKIQSILPELVTSN